MVFESTEEGRFRSKNSLPIRVIGPGWHNASIRSSSSGLILTIDQQASAMPTAARFAAGVVGFRAGMNGARIDDVVIEQRTGPSLRESFRNSKNWPRTFACNVGLLVLFGALMSRITLGRFWVVTKEGFFYWTMFSMVGFLCAGCWYAVDFYLYSKRVPRGLAITRPLNSEEGFTIPSFERLRFLAFEAWYGLSGGETITHQGVTDRGYPDRRIFRGPIYCGPTKEACVEGMPAKTGAGTAGNAPAYRVLLIGSSQTTGSGAKGSTGDLLCARASILARGRRTEVAPGVTQLGGLRIQRRRSSERIQRPLSRFSARFDGYQFVIQRSEVSGEICRRHD